MQGKEISEQFYREIFRLSGWEYSAKAVSDKSLYLRAAADKFIYQDLPLSDQKSIDSKARSSNMAIPPSLHLMISNKSVQEKTLQFLKLSKDYSSISDLGQQDNIEQEKNDFGKLLSVFLSAPDKS